MTEIREVSVDELRHLVSDRARSGETMLLNMGPQHPSTHGVLRLLLELDGETVISCIPDIGFLHTGVEKNMESKNYQQAEVMTDRLDYLNPIGNNLVYSLAVEKLLDLDVPERAQVIRVFSSPKAGVAANSQGRCGATQRLEAEGDVYYVTPSQAVRGDRAVYVAETDTITITGNVVVTQGKSVARGDRMTVKVKTGQVNLESTVKGRGKPGRVRGVFYPSETADAAPAAR